MSTVSMQMQLHYAQFPKPVDQNDDHTWIFDRQLSKQNPDFVLSVLKNIRYVKLEYDVLQSQLAELIQSQLDIPRHQNKLITALILAETLEYCSYHYLVDQLEAAYYQQQILNLRKLLASLGYTFPKNNLAIPGLKPEGSLSQTISRQTNFYNMLRQITQRSRRFVLEVNRLMATLRASSVIDSIDNATSPILNYLFFLLFIPRTISNLCIIGKHVFPGAWMQEPEKQLHWRDRLSLQLNQRGFQLADDLVWCVVNFSICFVLIGPLSHWAMPMMMGQQICEVISRVAKLIVTVKPLLALKNHYLALLKNDALDADDKLEIEGYLTQLDARIHFEIKNLALNVLNSTTILILGLLTISVFFSAVPIIPAVAALLMVAATGVFYYLNRTMNKQHPNKPQALVDKASQLGLFAVDDRQIQAAPSPQQTPQFSA